MSRESVGKFSREDTCRMLFRCVLREGIWIQIVQKSSHCQIGLTPPPPYPGTLDDLDVSVKVGVALYYGSNISQ